MDAPGLHTPVNAPMTDVREMNDKSATTMSTGPPVMPDVMLRTFVRSTFVTRSSARSRWCSWPWPTSTATT